MIYKLLRSLLFAIFNCGCVFCISHEISAMAILFATMIVLHFTVESFLAELDIMSSELVIVMCYFFLCILGVLSLLIDTNYLVALCLILFLLFVYRGKHIVNGRGLALDNYYVPIIILLLFGPLPELLSDHPVMYSTHFMDAYYFTSLTSSVLHYGFGHAIFDLDSIMNYHIFGLFPSIFISKLSTVNSHVATWCFGLPFAVVSFVAAFRYFLKYLDLSIVRNVDTSNFAVLLFVILFPLNPKHLFSLTPWDSVWYGHGHTVPVLHQWASSIIIGIFIIVLHQRYKVKNKFLVVTSLIFLWLFLMWCKVTMVFVLFPLLFLSRFTAITWKIFNRDDLLLASTVIPSLLFYQFYYGNSMNKLLFHPFWYTENVFSVPSISLSVFLKSLSILGATILCWVWYKAAIICVLKIKRNWTLSFGIVLFFCLVVLFVFRIEQRTFSGVLVRDGSFDLWQFTRTWFLILDVFIVYKLYNSKFWNVKNVNYFFRFFSFFFVFLVLVYAVKFQIANWNSQIFRAWDREVSQELRYYNGSVKAIISDEEYSGNYLAAYDLTNWFCTILPGQGGYNYGLTARGFERYIELKSSICEGNFSEKCLNELLENKVEILIATPNTINYFNRMEINNQIVKLKNSEYLFKLRK